MADIKEEELKKAHGKALAQDTNVVAFLYAIITLHETPDWIVSSNRTAIRIACELHLKEHGPGSGIVLMRYGLYKVYLMHYTGADTPAKMTHTLTRCLSRIDKTAEWQCMGCDRPIVRGHGVYLEIGGILYIPGGAVCGVIHKDKECSAVANALTARMSAAPPAHTMTTPEPKPVHDYFFKEASAAAAGK